jgi:hypothetical protein
MSRKSAVLALVAFVFVPLVSSLGSAAPARAQAPAEVELVQTVGACPSGTAVSGALGAAVTLDLAGLTARADADAARTRVFCNVRLRLDVQPGYAAIVAPPQIKGAVRHDASGTAEVSVRWFVTGQSGDHWLKRVAADDAGGDFAETPAAWTTRTFGCGESPELNVLVDATARLRGDGTPVDPARFEAMSVQQIVLSPVLYKRCDGAPQ